MLSISSESIRISWLESAAESIEPLAMLRGFASGKAPQHEEIWIVGAWVYILRCKDGSYYTGLTRSQEPEKRLSEHNMGLSPNSFTARRLPVVLVYAEYFDMVVDAIAAERKIKGWSRAKKEALIANNWDKVVRLSKRRGGKY